MAWSAFVAGDLQRAAHLASDGAARLERDHRSSWYWNLRFLDAEILDAQSNRKAAEALLHEPVPPFQGLEQAEVRRLIDLAAIGSQSEAETAQLLERARHSATDPELLVRLKRSEAGIAYRQKRLNDAQVLYQQAQTLAAQSGTLYQEAYVLNDLSLLYKTLHRYEDSVAFGLRAVDTANRIGARRIAAFAHGNLGSAYALLGDSDAALKHQQDAIEILQKIGARSNLMIALGEMGLAYNQQDNAPKALEYYQRAFDLASKLGSDRDAARHAANIAITSIRSENWTAAEEWNERASELAAKSKYAFVESLVERNRAFIAWGRGHADEAAAISRQILAANPNEPFIRWESYYLLGQIDSAAKRFPQANRDFESALATIGQVRSELLDPDNRIRLFSWQMPLYDAYVATAVDQNDDARALRVVESSRAQVLSERLGRSVETQLFPSNASFQQAAAATRSSILCFWIGPKHSFGWLVTPNIVKRFPLPPFAEISSLVTQYRQTVEHSLHDPVASSDAAGFTLWHALVEPIAPLIPTDKPLIVIPDGPLHRLNLETLIVPGPRPHYWIEDIELAVAPSITIAASAPRTEAASARAALLIGNPSYQGTAYEPLPKAADEIRRIQAHLAGWTPQVYQGPQASPQTYRQANPGRFSLIHFAAHAEANVEQPLESAVVLSPSGGQFKLFARDVTEIPIHADLVTISACRSAGARTYGGEGLLGFTWAFLNAGARAVIAGLWDVSDSSTSDLMDRLYAGIASGQQPSAALRAAKRALLNGPPNFRKPFYWAPFQIYLGSAARSTSPAPSETRAGMAKPFRR